jgi:hypothetical protein
MVIKAFLIVSVISPNLSVMPRCSGANEFVFDLVVRAEHIKRYDIRLKNERSVMYEDRVSEIHVIRKGA